MRTRMQVFAQRFAREVEERKLWWLALFTIIYLFFTLLNALRKPLWFDELFTVYLARLPSLGDLWSALGSGFDPNPPLPYLLTRFSFGVLGEGPVAARLPAVVGFWSMCVCLFFFVRRSSSALHAAVAMALPLVTTAYLYAYEARGYALALGSSALALLCWQAVDGPRRGLALGGLALGVALGVSSHYYAVLALCALGLGELCRTLVRRRLDLLAWLAMGLGLAPLAAYVPLMRRAVDEVALYTLRMERLKEPAVGRLTEYYTVLLGPALPAMVAGLTALAVALKLGALEKSPTAEPTPAGPPWHELVAVVGFLLLPVFLHLGALVVTGAYMDRYALPAIVGCASLLGFLLHQTARGRPEVGVILLGCFLGWFVVDALVPGRVPYTLRGPVLDARDPMFPPADGRPIAVANAMQYLEMHHHASPEVVSRICYLSDPQRAVRQPDFIAELALRGLRERVPIRVEEYAGFLAAHRSFWVYHNALNQVEWLVEQLAADGWRVELLGQDRDLMLFLVTRREAQADNAAGGPPVSR